MRPDMISLSEQLNPEKKQQENACRTTQKHLKQKLNYFSNSVRNHLTRPSHQGSITARLNIDKNAHTTVQSNLVTSGEILPQITRRAYTKRSQMLYFIFQKKDFHSRKPRNKITSC